MKLLKREINDLIYACGMQKVLEALINELNGNEDYIVKLKEDLTTALKNYEDRYKDDENK